MVTNSHYDVEDTPPIGSEIDLYEQTRQAVADIVPKAETMAEEMREALAEIFDFAAGHEDHGAMQRVNLVWDRSQHLINNIVHQHQALTGADVAIDQLKQQRLELAEELEALVQAIQAVDSDHPRLSKLVVTLREEIEALESEWATQVVYESFYKNLVPMVKQGNPHANAHKRIDWFLQLLQGDRRMTAEQHRLITEFFGTMGN